MLHPGVSLRRFCWIALATAFLLPLLGAAAFAQPVSGWSPFGPGGGNVTSVAVDPTDPAVATDSVYKSADGGVTWQARLGPNHSTVAVDPSHPAIAYAGGTSIARSRDGGQTWRTVLTDSRLVNGVASLAVAPSRAAVLYAGSVGWGVARSTSAGARWRIGAETGLGDSSNLDD